MWCPLSSADATAQGAPSGVTAVTRWSGADNPGTTDGANVHLVAGRLDLSDPPGSETCEAVHAPVPCADG